jgi:hypothetical protein
MVDEIDKVSGMVHGQSTTPGVSEHVIKASEPSVRITWNCKLQKE